MAAGQIAAVTILSLSLVPSSDAGTFAALASVALFLSPAHAPAGHFGLACLRDEPAAMAARRQEVVDLEGPSQRGLSGAVVRVAGRWLVALVRVRVRAHVRAHVHLQGSQMVAEGPLVAVCLVTWPVVMQTVAQRVAALLEAAGWVEQALEQWGRHSPEVVVIEAAAFLAPSWPVKARYEVPCQAQPQVALTCWDQWDRISCFCLPWSAAVGLVAFLLSPACRRPLAQAFPILFCPDPFVD